MTAHGPVLPVWLCAGCSAPWPCATRRNELLQEYATAPISLALLMGSYYVAASQDINWALAGTLHRRFLGWVR
ncbi:hypothetical protein ACH4OY_20360 [Micromonospora rubida]|uniref:Flavin reductase n=1 Tax=Micromonospora rubida TaxID=2697657 RepID=A0ABW7SMV7_9ACTN